MIFLTFKIFIFGIVIKGEIIRESCFPRGKPCVSSEDCCSKYCEFRLLSRVTAHQSCADRPKMKNYETTTTISVAEKKNRICFVNGCKCSSHEECCSKLCAFSLRSTIPDRYCKEVSKFDNKNSAITSTKQNSNRRCVNNESQCSKNRECCSRVCFQDAKSSINKCIEHL